MVLSDSPYVYGWNEMLRFNFVFNASCKLFQKCEVNLESLSDIIEMGIPCSLTISLIYNFPSVLVVSVILTARKYVDLVKRSTMTQTESRPFDDRGKPATKSIVM